MRDHWKKFTFCALLALKMGLLGGCGSYTKQSETTRHPSSLPANPQTATCRELARPFIESPTIAKKKIHKTLAEEYEVDSRDLEEFYETIHPRRTNNPKHPLKRILKETPERQRYLASAILYLLQKRKPHHSTRSLAREYRRLTQLCNV